LITARGGADPADFFIGESDTELTHRVIVYRRKFAINGAMMDLA